MCPLDRPVWSSLNTWHSPLSIGDVLARRPFLHAWKTNLPAIALYESLGFEIRTEVNVAVLERAG